jgi:hypothetical protein
MNIPNPVQTPVGGGATAAGVVTLISRVILPPVWPWWAHQASTWTGAVETVVIFGLTYLGGWLSLVRVKGQQVTLALTASRLPTVQAEAPAEPAAAAGA